ncbi:hypothetical protein R75465_05981 [Paraburkholderia aspalathi]|jgi:hypothetical protein|uniref:hypothetical protein n=1 Tax=Paraburkholderia aspalathi TaxID=1324617 RepID=UPI001B039904|nr:hypothetical protein R75465_05981 [Paraburkholderia aspalathi]
MEGLEYYAHHPKHLRVKRNLENLRIARYQVDYDKAQCSARTNFARRLHPPGSVSI